MIKNKIIFSLIIFWLFLFIGILFVSGFQGNSPTYSSDNRIDSFSDDNSDSVSFTQRIIGGIKRVGDYVSNTFNGRFGILDTKKNLAINLTSHLDNQEIIRGKDTVSGEDDKGFIKDIVNFTARVFENSTTSAFQGANCYFYDGGILFGNATTNSSGQCTVNFTKTAYDESNRNISVNYSINTSDTINIARSEINISLLSYISKLTMGNFRSSGCASGVSNCYLSGDNATLKINITKIDVGKTIMYDPINISANATNAAESVYNEGDFFYPSGDRNITRDEKGIFSVNITVNQSFGNQIRWDVIVSDNNFTDLISTAVHSDVAICAGDFGDWSSWGSCSSSTGTQTRSRTDSTSCTEVETRTCSSGTTGDGGSGGGSTGTTCIPSWSDWNNWGECIGGEERRTRNDGCGSTETEIRSCGCEPNWVCSDWGECTDPLSGSGSSETLGVSYEENIVIGFENLGVEKNFVNEFREELPVLTIEKNILPSTLPDISQNGIVEDSYNFVYGAIYLVQDIFYGLGTITSLAIIAECNDINDIGDKQCHQSKKNVYQECIERKFSIFGGTKYVWKNYRCERGLTCVGDGECSCSKINACDVEGAQICSSLNKYKICQPDSNGCLKWGRDNRCSRKEVCSLGACISGNKAEANICDIGNLACRGNRVYECVENRNTQSWNLKERCSYKETCFDGECFINHCFNLRQDGDEQGIDCGGSCEECPLIPVCGNGDIEVNEICDGDSLDCTLSSYSGIQNCKTDCSGYGSCISSESCGDTIINGNEECDDGNVIGNDGCSSICKIEIIEEVEEPKNETIIPEESIPKDNLDPDQILIGVKESISVSINKGDQLSVTYEELMGDKVILRITRLATPLSTEETEVHIIFVDVIDINKVTVTVTSDPITKDIIIGDTEIFDFNIFSEQLPQTPESDTNGGDSGGGTSGEDGIFFSPELGLPYQSRTCTDLNKCNTDVGKPEEIQQCIIDLTIEYLPQNTNLAIVNGTNVDFLIKASKASSEEISIKWYLDSIYILEDSNQGNVESIFDNIFIKDAEVKAVVSVDGSTQNVIWQVKINSETISECNENWVCDYSICNESGYKYAENCQDLNNCGSNLERPVKKTCDCIPKYECNEFTECLVDFNLDDILNGEPTLTGVQERTCEELIGCEDEESFLIERSKCTLKSDIRAEKVEWCFENYVDIYEVETDKLIGRVKERVIESISRIDISFTTTEFEGICGYCFDGVKNYDEQDIDCGGQVCQECIPAGSFFDYLYYAKFSLWGLLILLMIYSVYRHRYKFVDMSKGAIWKIRTSIVTAKRLPMQSIKLPRFKLPHIHIKIGGGEPRANKIRRVEREAYLPMSRIEPKFYGRLRSKLRAWKNKGYYETTTLEHSLANIMNNMRKSTHLVKELRLLEKIKIKRERKLARERKRADKYPSNLLNKRGTTKKININRFFSSLFNIGKNSLAEKIRGKTEKKKTKKEMKHYKRKLRNKQLSSSEASDLRKKLTEWRKKGYSYGTTRLQKKLDKYDGKDPFS